MTTQTFEMRSTPKAVEMYLYDVIGGESINAKAIADGLQTHKGKPLNMFINSPGGNAFEALAVYNLLRRHNAPITATIDGEAASAAHLIYMAADERNIAENAFGFIHMPWTMAAGNATEFRRQADELERLGEKVLQTYTARGSASRQDFESMLEEETFLDARQSVELGLSHNITDPLDVALSRDAEKFPYLARRPERRMSRTQIADRIKQNASKHLT